MTPARRRCRNSPPATDTSNSRSAKPRRSWLAGLSHGNDGTGYADIDFAFRFNGAGWADVLENGVYAGGDTPYAAGDVFRVAVVGGRVQYSRNGLLLRESAHVPQYPLLLDTSLGSIGATVRNAVLGVSPPPPPGGGFIETAGSPALRPAVDAAADTGLPAAWRRARRFTFPAPYNTTGIRLTNDSDCADGQDCLWYAGYSYWRNINNHAGSADMYIFLGTDRNRGGVGPMLLRYNKITDEVQPLGSAVRPGEPVQLQHRRRVVLQRDAADDALYVSRRAAAAAPLQRRHAPVRSRPLRWTCALARGRRVCPAGATSITQPHSSDDDLVHSATVQNADWVAHRLCRVRGALRRFRYYGIAERLRVRRMPRRQVRPVGAAARKPPGRSAAQPHRGAAQRPDHDHRRRQWRARPSRHGTWLRGRSRHVQSAAECDDPAEVPGHCAPSGRSVRSCTSTSAGTWPRPITSPTATRGPACPPESQYACGSNASRVADMADEIVCFPLDAARNADGSLSVVVVAPVMTDLDAPGGGDADGTTTSRRRRATSTSPADTSCGRRTWAAIGWTRSSSRSRRSGLARKPGADPFDKRIHVLSRNPVQQSLRAERRELAGDRHVALPVHHGAGPASPPA